MPLTFTGKTTLTPLQLEEFERVFSAFTDRPREDTALVRDLEYMLKCLGYGYRRVSEEELASLRSVVDPTDSGYMTYDAFVRVIGRFVAPPPDEEYLRYEEEDAAREGAGRAAGTRSRSASLLTSGGGVGGRRRGASLFSSNGNNNLTAHRAKSVAPSEFGGSAVEAADKTMEMWSTFRLFDKDKKGYITAGDLSIASRSYCGSMLSERDCFFIVNTLKVGWMRDGLTIDDFTRAMLK